MRSNAWLSVSENPQVAIDSKGNAVAVWAATFNGTAWGQAGFIDLGPPQSNLGIRPRVAMDGSGNALVVWSQKQGSNIPVYSARCSGGSWATAVH